MHRRPVTIDLDQDAACAADAQVTEGEIVERAVRAMDLRALVAQIRGRSDLDEDAAMRLVHEELRAARANMPRDPHRRGRQRPGVCGAVAFAGIAIGARTRARCSTGGLS
jgi:hypothetical protein